MRAAPQRTGVPGVLLVAQEFEPQLSLLHPPAVERHRRRYGQQQLRSMDGGMGRGGGRSLCCLSMDLRLKRGRQQEEGRLIRFWLSGSRAHRSRLERDAEQDAAAAAVVALQLDLDLLGALRPHKAAAQVAVLHLDLRRQ